MRLDLENLGEGGFKGRGFREGKRRLRVWFGFGLGLVWFGLVCDIVGSRVRRFASSQAHNVSPEN